MGRYAVWPPRIHHHKSGRDRVRWRGRDIWLGRTGSPEARARYLEVVAEIDRHGDPHARSRAADLTVEEFVAWWRRYAPRVYRPTSNEPANVAHALDVLRDLYGPQLAREIGPRWLKAAQQEMARRGWARTTVNHNTVRLKTAIKMACEEEVIPPSVYAAARRYPGETGRGLHLNTLRRWVRGGVSGVRLGAWRVAGRWYTTVEALDRFHRAVTERRERTAATAAARPAATGPGLRSERERERAYRAAKEFNDAACGGRAGRAIASCPDGRGAEPACRAKDRRTSPTPQPRELPQAAGSPTPSAHGDPAPTLPEIAR